MAVRGIVTYDDDGWLSGLSHTPDAGHKSLDHEIYHSYTSGCRSGSAKVTGAYDGWEEGWLSCWPDDLFTTHLYDGTEQDTFTQIGSLYMRFTGLEYMTYPAIVVKFAEWISEYGDPFIAIDNTDHQMVCGGIETGWGGHRHYFYKAPLRIEEGRWYRVDFKRKWYQSGYGGSQFFDFQVNGAPAPTWVFSSGSFSSANYYNYGLIYGSPAQMTAWFDDVLLSVDEADYPIGPHKCQLVWPDSDGVHNNSNIADYYANLINGTTVHAWHIAGKAIGPDSGSPAHYDIRQYGVSVNSYVECCFQDTSASAGVKGVVAGADSFCFDPIHYANAAAYLRRGSTNLEIWGLPGATRYQSDYPGAHEAYIPPPAGGWTIADINSMRYRCGHCDFVEIPEEYTYAFWEKAWLLVAYDTETDVDPAITDARYAVPSFMGWEAATSVHAYMATNSASGFTSAPAYIRGGYNVATSKPAYTKGWAHVATSKPAFMWGYLPGQTAVPAYIRGQAHVNTSAHAFIEGFAAGSVTSVPAFIEGATGFTRTSVPAYLVAEPITGGSAAGSVHAYIEGATGFTLTSVHAYISGGPITSGSPFTSVHAYISGG